MSDSERLQCEYDDITDRITDQPDFACQQFPKFCPNEAGVVEALNECDAKPTYTEKLDCLEDKIANRGD